MLSRRPIFCKPEIYTKLDILRRKQTSTSCNIMPNLCRKLGEMSQNLSSWRPADDSHETSCHALFQFFEEKKTVKFETVVSCKL